MSGTPAGETSPLLDVSGRFRRESVLFRRSRLGPSRGGISVNNKPRDTRASVRVPREFSSLATTAARRDDEHELRPVDALSPLVAGGVITDTDGYSTEPHPPSVVKSLPAFAPFRRRGVIAPSTSGG